MGHSMENINIESVIFGILFLLIGLPLCIWAIQLIIASIIMLNYSTLVKNDLSPLLTQTEKILAIAIQHRSYTDFVHMAVIMSNKRIIFYRRNSVFGQPSISDIRLSEQINVTYQETTSLIANLIGLGKATVSIQSPTKSEVIDSLFKIDAQRIKRRIDTIKHS